MTTETLLMNFCVDGCPSCPTERLTRPGCLSGGGDREWYLSYRCVDCGRFWHKAWAPDLAIAWATEYQRSLSVSRMAATTDWVRTIAGYVTAASFDHSDDEVERLRRYLDQRLRDFGNG